MKKSFGNLKKNRIKVKGQKLVKTDIFRHDALTLLKNVDIHLTNGTAKFLHRLSK